MLATRDPVLAWKVGMGVTVAMGVAKLALAFAGEWVRRIVPRAGLLGSIAGVSVLLIAFLPMLKVITDPLVGFLSLGLILVALVGRIALPGRVPGALAAVAVGSAVYAVERWAGIAPSGHAADGARRVAPGDALADARLARRARGDVGRAVGRLAVRAGDRHRRHRQHRERDRRRRPLPDAGHPADRGARHDPRGRGGGVVQNTPYVGHPAYKAMGARAGYTLATGLVIGLGAMGGVVSILVGLVPEAAVAPILVFVGLEITAQAFLATPARHAPAVALAFVPTTAALVMIQLERHPRQPGARPGSDPRRGRPHRQALRLLGNGFILSALLWAAAAAMIIDRRLLAAAAFLSVGEPGKPLRADPLAARIGRPVLAGRERVGLARAAGGRLRSARRAARRCSRPGRTRRPPPDGPRGTAALDPRAPSVLHRSRCL